MNYTKVEKIVFCIADEGSPTSSQNCFAFAISSLFIIFKLIYGGFPIISEYLSSFIDAYRIKFSHLYWNAAQLRIQLKELEELFQEGKLTERQKDIYIETNMIFNEYIDQAFVKGE